MPFPPKLVSAVVTASAHGAITALVCLLGVLVGLKVEAAIFMIGAYTFREVEQLAFDFFDKSFSPWYDYVLDAMVPMLVAVGFILV